MKRSTGQGVLTLALGVLVGVEPAGAARESAGTQSVFVGSTGLRALGMGGAFTAIADDASALAWNPAGLAQVERMQFLAEQADHPLAGAEQLYVATAVPNWRWGVLALSASHVGVGGIERRDARDVLIGADLSSSEDEFTIGYGHSAGAAVTLGGSIKMQRQQVAGLGGNGLGADFGALLRPADAFGRSPEWMHRVTLGLHARNLVEPSLRLDQDAVVDPRSFTTGIAFAQPLTVIGTLVWALDVETLPGATPAVRAGFEVRPLAAMALRGGVSGGRVTAGAEMAWSGVHVLYSFEDHALEPTHHVGVVVPFGHTVTESRSAADAAQSQAFQTHLAEAFREREEARQADLLRRAGEARMAGDYERALQILASDDGTSTASADVATLVRRTLCDQGAAQAARGDWAGAVLSYGQVMARAPDDSATAEILRRCQRERDRHDVRTSLVRTLYGDALDAFAREDFATARGRLERALAADPADSASSAMLRRTLVAIQNRSVTLRRQATTALDLHQLDEASSLLGQLRGVDANAPGLAALVLRLDAARRAVRDSLTAPPPATSPTTSVAPSREAVRQADALYRQGTDAVAHARSEAAIGYWERAWSINPSDARVIAALKRECLLRGMDAYAAGHLDTAVQLWEKAVRVSPNDPQATGYLAKAREQLDRATAIAGDAK